MDRRVKVLVSPREQSRVSTSPASTSPSHFVLSRLSPRCSPSPDKAATFQTLMQRMKHFEDKSSASLERARRAAQQQPSQPSPVNQTSRKLVSSLAPIHLRFAKILEERDKHVEDLRQALTQREAEKEAGELRFSPRICKVSQARRTMTPDKFYEYTGQWAASATKKVNETRQELAAKEKKTTTFKPAINKSPMKRAQPLAQRVQSSLTVRRQKLETQRRAQTPVFTPSTNKHRSVSPEQFESRVGSSLDVVMKLAEGLVLPADRLCRK